MKVSAEDNLNRYSLIDAIAQLLTQLSKIKNQFETNLQKLNFEPIPIGLFGHWGGGKSSVLKLSEDRITRDQTEINYTVHGFNAWAYEHTDNIQADVAQEAINALTMDLNDFSGFINKCKLALQLNWRLNRFSLISRSIFSLVWFTLAFVMAFSTGW